MRDAQEPGCRLATRPPLSRALARAIIAMHPAARALPRVDAATFALDQLVLERTASKGYTPATNPPPSPIGRTHCPHCLERLDTRGADGEVDACYHPDCLRALRGLR